VKLSSQGVDLPEAVHLEAAHPEAVRLLATTEVIGIKIKTIPL
jgi:hypothetical protein